MKTLDITKKVESFGVHTIKIKDNSTKNIFKYAHKALQRIEQNGQPVFLEINTYREVDHVGINHDFELGYRKKDKQKLLTEASTSSRQKKKTHNKKKKK